MPLLTAGHGPEDRHRLGARLSGAGVASLVDVRRFPGSRNNPDARRDALERLIADVVVLGHGLPVQHLMPDGRSTPHRPSAGAVVGDGTLHWPR